MKSQSFGLTLLLLITPAVFGQKMLVADGHTDTYTLINKAFGGSAEEPPDCGHPAFGPHITQDADAELGRPVFLFHMHLTPDNDRCSNFGRQRNEIKTYGPSPDSLKGFYGDTVTFRWKFRLEAGFRPSGVFTHLHQVKAADGDDAFALITISAHAGGAQAGKPNTLRVIGIDSKNTTTILKEQPLDPFVGHWIEAYERIQYGGPTHGAGESGTYRLSLTDVATGKVLLEYVNPSLDLWRSGTTFVRPKWGIYRSLEDKEQLRDEIVRFNDFCLAKGKEDCRP